MNLTKTLGLVLLAVIGLFGCSGGSGSEPTAVGTSGGPAKKSDLKVGIVYDAGGINDGSFNASANRGIDKAARELGIDVSKVESKSPNDFEKNLKTLAERGCKLIFAIGITMEDSLKLVADQFPDVKFAIVDGNVDKPNVRKLLFSENEGSFLAGYAAAMASKSKKLGFVGGMQIGLIEKFYAGYVAGAKTFDPSIEVLEPKYTGDWVNQDLGKSSAAILFSGGADVVYHAAGKAGLGVIAAAKEQGKLAIGVDSDQDDIAPGFVLTSMIKRVDESVFGTIKDTLDGKFSAGEKRYDLKSNGVGLSEMKNTKDKLPADGAEKLKAIQDKIVSGELKAPSTLDELKAYLGTLKPS